MRLAHLIAAMAAAIIIVHCGGPSTAPPPSGGAGGAAASSTGYGGASTASSTSTGGASASSSASGGGAGGEGGGCMPEPGDVCSWTCTGFWPPGSPHPDGCTCAFECLPPSNPCAAVTCSGIQLHLDGGVPDHPTGGECGEVQRAPGQPCASGVGVCDGNGQCIAPPGNCMPVLALPPKCSTNADCYDDDPCTTDICVPGVWCVNQPHPDGEPCAFGRSCSLGACCTVSQ